MSGEPDREWQIQVYLDSPTRQRLGLVKAYLEMTCPALGQVSWSQCVTWLTISVPIGQLITEAVARIDTTITGVSNEPEREHEREPEPDAGDGADKPAKRTRRNPAAE